MRDNGIVVQEYCPGDRQSVVEMLAAFRVALSALRGHERQPDISQAEQELQEYVDKKYPVFVATTANPKCCVGYLVCKVEGDTVWAESLFVLPRFRRRGVAGMLYEVAENCAKARGQETLYNWVHPNNHAIIGFLKERGYDVLNLVEVRRRRPEEEPKATVRVGDHDFAY